MQIDVIKDTEGFRALKQEWHDLLLCSASNSLFLSWEWLYTWWEFLAEGRELHIITVRRRGQLLGIAPFTIKPFLWRHYIPFRALEFLGTGNVGSDYLNLIIRRGEERCVLLQLANYFTNINDPVVLSQLRADSQTATKLSRLLMRREWQASSTVTDLCPFILLSGHSWDSYVSSLGRSHRQNFRRKLRQMEQRFSVSFEQVCQEDQRRDALHTLFTLHNDRRSLIGGSNALHTDALRAFHEKFSRLALENGWLRLFTLKLNGNAAASLYGFRYDDVFYFYQSGFDIELAKYSPGLVTMGFSIERAIAEGATEYDMLHGDEAYKFLWASEKRELARTLIFPPNIKGRVSKNVLAIRQGAKYLMAS